MSNWSYPGTDPGIKLFTACEAHWPMPIKAGVAVLEIGYCESDWLGRAHQAWPDAHFTGIDWRGTNRTAEGLTFQKGDALNRDAYPAASFDAIVSLSAIEHFGLGHYHADPKDTDGDVRIMGNAWHWLKPGGWFYLDVPFDPHGYRVVGTSHRTYDLAALASRLCPDGIGPARLVVADASNPSVLHDVPPTTQPDDKLRYYVALLFQKGGV